jgi:transposase-like protein
MNRIYDVESDQLKCNFCTRYFKCSIHYANIQRYSLKACNECFSNFTYTVLHPTTYQIFRVFLLDVGITIPLENDRSQAKSDSSSLKM